MSAQVALKTYNDEVGSPFYQQFLNVLNQVNSARAKQGQPTLSFRQAVGSMGLRDPFTGKIKSGVYVPTTERLEALAEFLGVSPTVFDAYIKRFADKLIREDKMIDVFRKMAELSPEQQEILQAAIERYVDEVFQNLR